MILRKLAVCAAGVALLGLGSAAVDPPAGGSGSEVKAPEKAELGKPAPDFALKDVNGKVYNLSDYKGKMVVLQWIGPSCPVCNRVSRSGLVADMRKELKALDKDFVQLNINSTKNQTAQQSFEYLKKYNLQDIPALDDSEGEVGKLYGAKTTPHMYVIDKKGVLRYEGAFDDDPNGRSAKPTNYVVNAFKQILAGETVSPEHVQSYGCGVKYKR